MIARRNPKLARADAATQDGLRLIGENARDWSLTVAAQIVAILMTVAGLGVAAKAVPRAFRVVPTISAALFTAGAALMLLYLGFHVFITPRPPKDYERQRRNYARLYRVYMVAGYVALGLVGLAGLQHRLFAGWAGWFLVVAGAAGVVTAVARRPSVADLPLWIHVVALVLGFALISH